MKRISFLILVPILTAILFTSCSSTPTYAELLSSEKVQIADYIKRENINVLSSFPKDSIWKKNDYVLTSSGLYFHMVSYGILSDSVSLEVGNTVVPRYKQYSLAVGSDTISNWSTVDFAYPSTFVYGNYSQSCVAFQEAASYMNRNESVAKIIVPSKLGFNADMLSVTPYGYDLRIKIQK